MLETLKTDTPAIIGLVTRCHPHELIMAVTHDACSALMAVTDGTLQLQLMASKLDFKASSTPMLNLPISFQKQAASNIETVTSMTPNI